MEAGKLVPWSTSAYTYDQVNELLASGAPGLVWFPSQRVVGSDIYYYTKALEALMPVESLLVNSAAVPGVSATIGDPSDPTPNRYRLRATAVQSGNDYIILVSSYGQPTTQNEEPAWLGDIDVTLPTAVSGDVIRLADNNIVGSVAASNIVTFDFKPGIDGARTAVFHFCDTSAGSCIDTDGDGFRDDVDNCPTVVNPEQIDTDADNMGNQCDTDDDNDNLSDIDEFQLGTFPLVFDSDSDGFGDGDEVNAGTDPLDPDSFPLISDGDLNQDGTVNTADILIAYQIIFGNASLDSLKLSHGDVAPLVAGVPAPDGVFNIGDVLVIMRKVMGLTSF